MMRVLLLILSLTTSLSAQIRILQPKPGQPLDEEQTLIYELGALEPAIVELWLNDQLIAARSKPPQRFVFHWNTSLPNRIRLVARFNDQPERSIRQDYDPFQVDVSLETLARPCFPLIEREDHGLLRASCGSKVLELGTLQASNNYPLEMALLVDVSGSMRTYLPGLVDGLQALLTFAASQKAQVKVFAIDEDLRLFEPAAFLQFLRQDQLYREQGKSVIWDGLALAAGSFGASPRRLVLLVSDGSDDGSKHNKSTVEPLLQAERMGLVWLNPSGLVNEPLRRLASRSGGFVRTAQKSDFEALLATLSRTYVLILSDSRCELSIQAEHGAVYYPKW